MWNASYVQKHSNYTWQEGVGEKTRERIKKFPFPKPLLEARTKPNRYLLDRLRKPYRHWSDVKWKTESLVGKLARKTTCRLPGLAGYHQRETAELRLKLQVRWVDQTQYPMIVAASLSAVPQSCRTPLPLKTGKLEVLHLFRCSHTHTTHMHTHNNTCLTRILQIRHTEV